MGFLCNCSSGFTLIYCICPHGFFWCQFYLVNAKRIKAILVFPLNMCIWICQHFPQANGPTVKTQRSYKKNSRNHTFHTESHSTARSSASLPYRLLHSDELDQALKCPQRSISAAAFMFASGICFGIQSQLSLQREG